jgi:hypothetical protein
VQADDWLGAGIDFGSGNLETTIRAALKLSPQVPLHSEKTQLHLVLHIYSSEGQPVYHTRAQIPCADCFTHPVKPFLRWNLRSLDGRLAGNGAYIARILYRVSYDGQTVYFANQTENWGILRRNHGKP